MIKTGEVIKNEQTGKWELNKKNLNNQKQNNQNSNNKKCLLCENEIEDNSMICKNCQKIVNERITELDKNQSKQELTDYYYNSKDYAFRINDEIKIKYSILTMTAIAYLIKKLYNNSTLLNERLENDIVHLKENYKEKNEELQKYKDQNFREQIKEKENLRAKKTRQTEDGHFVESELEQKVDDILFTNSKAHAYGIKVDDITERTVECDWYIPVLINKGIYIELWGVVGDENYNNNKKEKLELYKKHKLKLLEITNGEAKGDTKTLKSLIINGINKLAMELKNE